MRDYKSVRERVSFPYKMMGREIPPQGSRRFPHHPYETEGDENLRVPRANKI